MMTAFKLGRKWCYEDKMRGAVILFFRICGKVPYQDSSQQQLHFQLTLLQSILISIIHLDLRNPRTQNTIEDYFLGQDNLFYSNFSSERFEIKLHL